MAVVGLHCCMCFSLVVSRGYSGCGVQTSHWRGLSCWGAQALGCPGFGSWGSQALEHRLSSCGSWAYLLLGTWDLPGSGVGPMSPVLAGRFLSTASLGKSYFHIFLCNCFSIFRYCKKPLTSNCTIQIATPGKGKKSTPKPIPILAAGFCSDKMSLLLVYGNWFQPTIERVVRRCSWSKVA